MDATSAPQDPDTEIVHSIKDPWRLILIDIDIAMNCAPIMFAGFLMQHEMIGIAAASIVAFKWQSSRTNNPKGAGLRWMWWHLPSRLWFMATHVSPPSHKREFIG